MRRFHVVVFRSHASKVPHKITRVQILVVPKGTNHLHTRYMRLDEMELAGEVYYYPVRGSNPKIYRVRMIRHPGMLKEHEIKKIWEKAKKESDFDPVTWRNRSVAFNHNFQGRSIEIPHKENGSG